ncbi:MAG: hypothetical protein WDL87_10550 [Candidatus Omnitrophota bacterium]|jgi:purine-nucleoside phosphorylase
MENKFEVLFGIKNTDVKRNCILMPLLAKDTLSTLGIEKFKRGKLYSAGNTKHFTLIVTGMGAGFVGDAVLYLKDTPACKVLLLGSCGLVSAKPGFDIGSLVSPVKSFSQESFAGMLSKQEYKNISFLPDNDLSQLLLEAGSGLGIKKVQCSTVSSLKLEEERVDLLSADGIDVVDMESSAFFSAASHAGLKAAALFYVSDIIGEKPWYRALGPLDKEALFVSMKKSLLFVRTFFH